MADAIDVSVVTPSYDMLGYLRRCCRSVADQAGVTLEHIVVDGGSRDGTPAWLARQPGLRFTSGPDEGMYDAINRGFARARGRVVAYLNCDEQYLPGALAAVVETFERRPDADVVFGDALLVRPSGELLAFRKAYPLRWRYVLASHLYVLSCATFLHRRVLEAGFRYDPRLRDTGDAELMLRVLRAGHRACHLRRYLAAFTMTGANRSAQAAARAEAARLRAAAPRLVRALRIPLNACRLAEKLCAGAYHRPDAIEYEIYTDDTEKRARLRGVRPSFRWRSHP